MFSCAEKIQPVIVFIDGIDSLLRSRSNEASNELSVTRGIKNLFMQHMDGLLNHEKKQIVVIGATNRKEDIDAAILRRIYPHSLINYPNTEERKEIFESILRNEQLDPNIDILKLAEETNGFSGSAIRDIYKTAALNILEEVVNSLKNKQVQVEPNPEKESEYICREMINDVLLEMSYNQKDGTSKKVKPAKCIKRKYTKEESIDRAFTTDDILNVVAQWRKKDNEQRDQFPRYI